MFDIGIIATTLTDGTARSKRLNIGGVDVLTPYSGSTSSFGVSLESIALHEAGPGGVSSLSFTINDPFVEVRFSDDALVEFWDITRNRPLFLGFLQSLSIDSTAVGRRIHVTCIGIETLLDWMLIPTEQVTTMSNGNGTFIALYRSGAWLASVIQGLIGNATGVGYPLRSYATTVYPDLRGSIDYPIAGFGVGSPALQEDLEVAAGTTLREAIAQAISVSDIESAFVDVDFYGGVRMYLGTTSEQTGIRTATPPSDYDSFTFANTSSGPHQPNEYHFDVDISGPRKGVFIKGSTTAGTGLVSSDKPGPGPIAYLEDDTIATAKRRNRAGAVYLNQLSQVTRVTASWTPMQASVIDAFNIRPGSDAHLGPDGQVLNEQIGLSVFSIDKTFQTGAASGNWSEEHWTMALGGLTPSVMHSIRRLTRDTRS